MQDALGFLDTCNPEELWARIFTLANVAMAVAIAWQCRR